MCHTTSDTTHESGISYGKNKVKERLQTSSQSRRVILHLKLKRKNISKHIHLIWSDMKASVLQSPPCVNLRYCSDRNLGLLLVRHHTAGVSYMGDTLMCNLQFILINIGFCSGFWTLSYRVQRSYTAWVTAKCHLIMGGHHQKWPVLTSYYIYGYYTFFGDESGNNSIAYNSAN